MMNTMVANTVDQHVFRRMELSPEATRAELESRQIALLDRTVRFVMEGCSFYRKRLNDYATFPITSLQDLDKLPFTDSDDIRESGHEMLCISQSEVARVVTMATSGSTGPPKRFSFSANDLQATKEFFYEGMLSLISNRDRVLVLLPWELPASVGDLLIEALLANGIHAQGQWPPDLTASGAVKIREDNFSCIVGLPQHLLALSEHLERGRLRSMLLCSDYASPSLRRRIEDNCGCMTFLHYGSTESGLGGGVECHHHAGCHVRESDIIIEVIDPQTCRQLPDNSPGELVLTTLQRSAMPLIRYRTGDRGAKVTAPCPCGGITARLTSLTGRIQSCQLHGGGILCSYELDDLLYPLPGMIDYRASLRRHHHDDRIDIRYTAVSGKKTSEAGIRSLLLTHPLIHEEATGEGLVIGEISRIDVFSADHTGKRTICDRRNERNNDAIYS